MYIYQTENLKNRQKMAKKTKYSLPSLTLFYIFILFSGDACYARDIPNYPETISNASSPVVVIHASKAAEKTCDQTYGFMPCTTTVMGNLFLILAYGYLMFRPRLICSLGVRCCLRFSVRGLLADFFLPILGALPDAMLILVSGLSGSKETAQKQVSVGMGLLAGSTVMLLTIIWGTCIIVGKCDLKNNVAEDSKDTKRFSLTGSGVSTDIWTSYAGIIMAISLIPFIIVQLPRILHIKSGRHLAVLISLFFFVHHSWSPIAFTRYFNHRRIAYAKHKHVVSGILKHFKMHALGKLSTEDGKPNVEVITKLFDMIDDNKDGLLSVSELRALIIGIEFNEIRVDCNDAVEKAMRDFDTTRDSKVDLNEFIAGVAKWLDEAKRAPTDTGSMKYIDEFHKQTKREHALLGDKSDEIIEEVKNPRWTSFKAALLLLLGSVIAAAFADPLVDVVDHFSVATKIPTFFISFIALPLATNSSEAVSAIIFASRKKMRSTSLTFRVVWSSYNEQFVVLVSVLSSCLRERVGLELLGRGVGHLDRLCGDGSISPTFPLLTSFLAFLLYPFSLALVYVLDYVLGWS